MGYGPWTMGQAALRAGLPNHLLRRRDPLHHLEPRVHAERQHALFDRAVADLDGADVLHDELPDLRRHHHDFVHALASLEARAVALIAAAATEETELADLRVEAHVLEE